jgi:hypothetical protein
VVLARVERESGRDGRDLAALESFSWPSRRSTIEPPTSVIPCPRAQPLIAATVSPLSRASAIERVRSCGPTPFHFSGRRTRSAPVEAARATRRSARSMLSAFDCVALSWTHATRSVEAMVEG